MSSDGPSIGQGRKSGKKVERIFLMLIESGSIYSISGVLVFFFYIILMYAYGLCPIKILWQSLQYSMRYDNVSPPKSYQHFVAD